MKTFTMTQVVAKLSREFSFFCFFLFFFRNHFFKPFIKNTEGPLCFVWKKIKKWVIHFISIGEIEYCLKKIKEGDNVLREIYLNLFVEGGGKNWKKTGFV